MKKIISEIILVIILAIVSILLIKKEENNSNLKQITIGEVAHSVFYAPMYVADSLGYFNEEGLDVSIVLTSGADNVMAAVLSGDIDIGFSGTEATIYVYKGNETDYVMTFAGLTQKDGSFLVSRKKIDNFKISDLKGKTVIGGRKGGMPEMTFEWALRQNGIDPQKDVNIDTSIAFSAMQGAFVSGIGDFVTLFEPNATAIEKQGLGYVVAYIGELGGTVPYTAFNARKSYIENNQDIIKSFSKAINKGLSYVHNNKSSDIAEKIIDYFPDTSLNDLITIIDRYQKGDAWKKDISISPSEWNHIQDIIIASNELDEYVDYDKLIYTKYFTNYD